MKTLLTVFTVSAVSAIAMLASGAESKPIAGTPPTITPQARTAGQQRDAEFVNFGGRWSDKRSDWIESVSKYNATHPARAYGRYPTIRTYSRFTRIRF